MHCFLVDENLFLPKTLFYLWFRIVPQLLSFYIYSLRQAWKSAAHVIVFLKNLDIMACQSSVSERILINSVVQKDPASTLHPLMNTLWCAFCSPVKIV